MDNSEIILPWAAYRKYFKVLKEKDPVNLEVMCMLCSPVSTKTYSCSRKSNSNLKKHLMRSHPTVSQLFNSGNPPRRRRSIQTAPAAADVDHPTIVGGNDQITKESFLKIWNLSSSTTSDSHNSEQNSFTQESLDKLIVDLIVDTAVPFSFVEEKTFQTLIQTGFPDIPIISQESVIHHIDYYAQNVQESIKSNLLVPNYVACTVDCWQIFDRIYLAITANWMNSETFQRESAALAFKTLKKRPDYELLTENLTYIFNLYNIYEKIVRITTDRGQNVYKNFSIIYGNESVADKNSIDLTTILCNPQLQTDQFIIPAQKCLCHDLIRIVTEDAAKAQSNLHYKHQLQTTIDRCKIIWQQQSIMAHEIKNKFDIELKEPTCWRTTYQTLKQIANLLQTNAVDFNLICEQFGFQTIFTERDLVFLTEYLETNGPIYRALEILQRPKSQYLGYFLPTITVLHQKLMNINGRSLKFCAPLASVILQALTLRFEPYLHDKNLILAAITHPLFKFYWIDDVDSDKLQEYRSLLHAELIAAKPEQIKEELIMADVEEDNFFPFINTSSTSGMTTSRLDELEMYLNNVNDLTQLSYVPNVKKLFVKYNTGLPASELLAGVDLEMFRKQGEDVRDEDFEKVLLLKANNFVKNS